MAVHFHVKKGDTVEVISGNHRGANGKILQVLGAKQQVLIEGVRLIKKHTKRTQDNPQGGILEREGPIHISNVKLVEKHEKPVKGAGKKKEAAKPKAEKAEKPKKEKASKKSA
jgi:large subunit ribosomal protein L24